MAYLYNRENGTNAYTIQHRANIPSQDYNRFRGFLEDLCSLSLLDKKEEETGGEKKRINYIITEDGRTLVKLCRNPLIQSVFGEIEDLFIADNNS